MERQFGSSEVAANHAQADFAIRLGRIVTNSKKAEPNTTVGYPIYDAHGNMVGDVSKYGSSFQANDKRSFDAWGNIRQGAQTGAPKGRYCANLGHKQDDESGLIYMRARYYEPTSGRFISQDQKMVGYNWFSYCYSNPVNFSDGQGHSPQGLAIGLLFSLGIVFFTACIGVMVGIPPSGIKTAIIGGLLTFSILCLATADSLMPGGGTFGRVELNFGAAALTALAGTIAAIATAANAAWGAGLATGAIIVAVGEDVSLLGELVADGMDPSQVQEVNGE